MEIQRRKSRKPVDEGSADEEPPGSVAEQLASLRRTTQTLMEQLIQSRRVSHGFVRCSHRVGCFRVRDVVAR